MSAPRNRAPSRGRTFLSPQGLILCALVLVAALLLWGLLSRAPQGVTAVVEQKGQVVLRRNLSQLESPETVSLEGEQGIALTIELSSQGARVLSSTCPDQICVRAGLLTRAGETAVCMPAQVVLRLEGPAEGAVDAATG